MMKKIKITAILVIFVCSQALYAEERPSYLFLRTDVGARVAGLNGSFVSMTNDPLVIFYNPAALTTLTQQRISLGFERHLLDVNGGHLAYAREYEGLGYFGAGIHFIDYGSFTETDESMNTLGTFAARDLAISAGYGTTIDEATSIGVGLKFIYSSLASYTSSALAMDVGVLYQIPAENITLGASILNLGTQLSSFGMTKERLPLDVKIGVTKRPQHLPVLLNLNFHRLNETNEKLLNRFSAFSIGAEFLMSESVRFRFGYNNQLRKDLKLGSGAGFAGMSLGGGIVWKDYVIDYAFNSYGKIGALHRFSLGIAL
ncbi:MAG: type IX secretion system protein PorQ [bacterium]